MRFEKVSLEQYMVDCKEDTYYTRSRNYKHADLAGESEVTLANSYQALKELSTEEIYEDISLPKRATKKSAGYDFYAPYDIYLAPGETIKLATGIRVLLDDDKFLMCAPRSSHGFKSRIQLDNTIGIIDADYYEADNEGHIHVKLTNDSKSGRVWSLNKGDAMMQAIIVQYFKIDEDDTSSQRLGGIGSTNI